MTFGYQTRGTMAQASAASSEDAARTFVYKHLGVIASKMAPLRVVMSNAEPEAVQSMVLELLANNEVLRAAASAQHVFDSAVDEWRRWVLHDGWIVESDGLVRVTLMAEEVTGVGDKLAEDLATSGIDSDAAVRGAIKKFLETLCCGAAGLQRVHHAGANRVGNNRTPIPYDVPTTQELPERVGAVLQVIHLVF